MIIRNLPTMGSSGFKMPTIKTLNRQEMKAIAITSFGYYGVYNSEVYKSTDNGVTFIKEPVNGFSGVADIKVVNNVLFLFNFNERTIFSTDGITFTVCAGSYSTYYRELQHDVVYVNGFYYITGSGHYIYKYDLNNNSLLKTIYASGFVKMFESNGKLKIYNAETYIYYSLDEGVSWVFVNGTSFANLSYANCTVFFDSKGNEITLAFNTNKNNEGRYNIDIISNNVLLTTQTSLLTYPELYTKQAVDKTFVIKTDEYRFNALWRYDESLKKMIALNFDVNNIQYANLTKHNGNLLINNKYLITNE